MFGKLLEHKLLTWQFLSKLLGLILIAASVLKGHELATGAVLETDFWSSRWFLIGVIEGQFLLGIWLVLGIHPRAARAVALAVFALFAVITLVKGLAGESSCGCFGRVGINPWYVLVFDLAVLAALWLWRPDPSAWVLGARPRRLAAAMSAGLVMAASGAVVMASFNPALVTAEGDIIGDSPVVALDPDAWLGGRFPLLRHIDVGPRLAQGKWIVLLHRHNCSLCQDAIPYYVQLAHDLAGSDGTPHVALIEMPPYGEDDAEHSAKSPCLRGRLTEEKQWQAALPSFIRLVDGQVELAARKPEVLLNSPLTGAAGEMANSAPAANAPPGLSPFPDYQKALRTRHLSEVACGPLALITVMRALRVPVSAEDADRITAAAGSHGTDLLKLKELAEEHGLHAVGVAVSPQKLMQLRLPAVVHDGRYGFAAVTGFTGDGFRVIFPFQRPMIVSIPRYARTFGKAGRSLLVSKEPLSADQLGIESPPTEAADEPGSRLRLERGVLSVGRIYTLDWHAAVKVHNDGNSDLRIKEVKINCGPSYKASVDATVIRPKQATTLRASGSQKGPGRIACAVDLITDQETVTVPIRGYAEQAVLLEKPALAIEGVAVNREARATLAFELAAGLDASKVNVKLPEKAPLEAKVQPLGGGKASLQLRWLGADKPEWYRYSAELRPGDVPAAVVTQLLLAVHVVPEIDVFPPSLLIREEELASAWKRKLTFRLPDDIQGSPTFTASDREFEKAVRLKPLTAEGNEVKVSLEVSDADLMRRLAGKVVNMTFRFEQGRSAPVPVYLGERAFQRARDPKVSN